MQILYYTWEVICQAWPIILIMGMIAIPILLIWFNESDEEYEGLNQYYDPSTDKEVNNI